MSVVSVQEMPVGRNGTPEETADNRTVSRQWLVTVNDPNDNIFTIVNDGNYFSSGIPSYLSPHPANVFYTCRSVELDPQSPLHWYAIATYSTAPVSQEDRERNEQPNPLDRRLKFSVDTIEFQRYSDKDANGDPYKNSADVPYPAQVHEDARIIIRLRKNITTWNTAWFALRNSVNENAMTITDGVSTVSFDAEKGLLKRLVMGEVAEENGYVFYPLSAEVHLNNDGWKKQLVDQGFTARAASGKLIRMKVYDSDDSGVATTTLVDTIEELPLGGNGKPLFMPDGSAFDPAITELQFNEFDEFPVRDWGPLPFWS